jgi:hypothetical protein
MPAKPQMQYRQPKEARLPRAYLRHIFRRELKKSAAARPGSRGPPSCCGEKIGEEWQHRRPRPEPGTLRQLPLVSYRGPARRLLGNPELMALGLVIAAAAGALYWLGLPH